MVLAISIVPGGVGFTGMPRASWLTGTMARTFGCNPPSTILSNSAEVKTPPYGTVLTILWIQCALDGGRDITITISYPVVTFNEHFQSLFCIRLVSNLYKLDTHGIGMVFTFF
jgi:hypothetical protein